MKKKILIISILLLAVAGCTKKENFSNLEKELSTKATKYYEDYLKGKVLGFDNHKITLEALETAKVDISNFSKKSCDKGSYALIKLTLNENREPVGNIEVENHLTCGEYTTPTQNK